MLVKVIIFPVMYSFANDSAFCASITRTTQKSFLEFGENRAPYLPYSIESVQHFKGNSPNSEDDFSVLPITEAHKAESLLNE